MHADAPFEPLDLISPGQVLLMEFMEPRRLTGQRLAVAVGMKPSYLSLIINGKRPISTATAIRFAAYFGNSAQFWLNLQTAYDLELFARTGKYAEITGAVDADIAPRGRKLVSV
ncbi:MAG: HigA family addiction module antidote protein [Planctomycetota bacterium]|jgi:addiction module HigA family antidote|nr:HigA family addiction module antidote protein [Planctomycetota bacterium]